MIQNTHEDIQLSLHNENILRLHNQSSFTTPDNYALHLSLLCDGISIWDTTQALPDIQPDLLYKPSAEPMCLKHKNGLYVVYSDHLLLNLDDTTGWITKYTVDGFDRLLDLRLSTPDCQYTLLSIESEILEQAVLLHVTHELDAVNNRIRINTHYTIGEDGRILVRTVLSVSEPLPIRPHIGMRLQTPSLFQNVSWYGSGPMETFPDRQASERLGRYHTTVPEDALNNYFQPALLAVSDTAKGIAKGIAICTHQPMAMKAVPYTHEEPASRVSELPVSAGSYVYVDFLQTKNGNRSWDSEILLKYQIESGELAYAFTMIPFSTSEDPIQLKNYPLS